MPDITVIIVSWNVRSLLEQCLSALLTPPVQGGLELEIIVVDNASSDGSADAAETFPGVKVIRNAKNFGYGRASNIGIEAAKGANYLILNPDTVPLEGSIPALFGALSQIPSAGIVSPRLLYRDGSFQPAAFRFPTLMMAWLDLFPPPELLPGRVRAWLLNSRLNGRYPAEATAGSAFKIDHPLGACMLIRGEAYRECGGFSPELYMYSEEIDLAIRYRARGWECWQEPRSRVIHLGGQSTSQAPAQMYVELWRSRLYIYGKYYSPVASVALRAMLMLGQVASVLTTLVRYRQRKISRDDARRRWNKAGAALRLVFRS